MKRIGNIIHRAADIFNIDESLRYVLRGKIAQTIMGRHILSNREFYIDKIRQDILEGKINLSNYSSFTIIEHGKTRQICSIPYLQRIYLNAVMKVVEEELNKTFIRTTASSIKGKGTLFLHCIFRKNMINDSVGTKYTYKCDIHHFYQSIPRDKMWQVILRYIKDQAVLKILHECIFFQNEGLSIGLRSSQVLANLYLSHYVDHVLKDDIGIKYYYRYCDDIVIQAESKKKLQTYITILKECIRNAGLVIKNNDSFWETEKRPVDYLGYITYSNGKVLLRKHIKHRFAKRWKRVKSHNRKVKLIGSFYGVAKHSHSRNLFRKLTGIDMKKFSELGLVYNAENAKTYFDVPYTRQSDLVNCTIILLDYTECTTKQGEQYVVLYKYEGKEGKFFASNKIQKNLLEQLRAANAFPVETTIKKKNIVNGFLLCFT